MGFPIHGNGNTINRGMGMKIMRMGMGIKTRKWENIEKYM